MSSEALERRRAQRLAEQLRDNIAQARAVDSDARTIRQHMVIDEIEALLAALAVAREREQLLHDYLAGVASCTPHKRGCDEPDDPSCAACIAAAGLAAHAAALAEPETGQLSRPLRASAAGTLGDQRAAHVPSAGHLASGSASAAADEPGETP